MILSIGSWGAGSPLPRRKWYASTSRIATPRTASRIGRRLRSAGVVIPPSDAQPLHLSGGRLDLQYEVCRRRQHVENDNAVVLRFNLGETPIIVEHPQHAAKTCLPSGGQIEDQREPPVEVVIRM